VITTKTTGVFDRLKHFNYSAQPIAVLDHSLFSTTVTGSNRCGAITPFRSAAPRSCAKGFNLQVDVDGQVFLCCNDMAKQFSPGNVENNSLLEIWFSPKVVEMRRSLFAGEFVGAPCNTCKFDFRLRR